MSKHDDYFSRTYKHYWDHGTQADVDAAFQNEAQNHDFLVSLSE